MLDLRRGQEGNYGVENVRLCADSVVKAWRVDQRDHLPAQHEWQRHLHFGGTGREPLAHSEGRVASTVDKLTTRSV